MIYSVLHIPTTKRFSSADFFNTAEKRPWTVVCMTNGDADGDGRKRRRQFEKACKMQGVADAQWWGFPDIFEKRLDVQRHGSETSRAAETL